MPSRFWKILINWIVDHNEKSLNIETTWTSRIIDETKQISFFLQERFWGYPINEERNNRWKLVPNLSEDKIIEIFEIVLNWINYHQDNLALREKTLFVLLDYFKEKFFFKGKKLSDKLLIFIEKNNLNSLVGEYINQINKCVYNKNIEPYNEIAYLLFLLWIPNEYSLIDDIKFNNFDWIKKFLEKKISLISKESKWENIDKICLIMNILNQLTIVLSINAEEKIFGYELFNGVLIEKTHDIIEKYLNSINEDIIAKSNKKNGNIDYSKESEWIIWEKEHMNINKLQDILWKFYYNFSSNLEYIQVDSKECNTKEKKISFINTKIWEILEKLSYWYILRESAKFWNKMWEELEKAKKSARTTTDWNIAFTKLIWIKKLKSFKLNEREHSRIEMDCIDDLIKIYNESVGNSLSLSKEQEIIEHFIKSETPNQYQMITVYTLILFCDFDFELIQDLILYLTDLNKDSPSTIFKKLKIKTLELVLDKITSDLTICKNIDCMNLLCNEANSKICNKMVSSIEDYIKNSKQDSLIYNYWKLYLSLANIYSKWDTIESILRAKKYYVIFQEKFWNHLPGELKKVTQKIEDNITANEVKLYSFDSSLELSKKYFLLKSHHDMLEKIFKLIKKIQDKKWLNSHDIEVENIHKEICTLIKESLFNWSSCTISIEQKKWTYEQWLSESVRVLRWDHLDIVFRYDSFYKETFEQIFQTEKVFIQERILQLIDINEDYSQKSQDFSTIIELAWDLMERKDMYTGWHISRVKEQTKTILEILWYNEVEINKICTSAMVHDIGKISVPDVIIKKPVKLTTEEIFEMWKHTWNWVIVGVKKKWNISYLEWMTHHCNYYSPKWNSRLTFEWLIGSLRSGKKVDPSEFNKLLWRNIPIASRIIMIPDVIDAIASRRLYDSRAWLPIEEIINIVDAELFKGWWLKKVDWKIVPDEAYWWLASMEDLYLPYIFEFEWQYYEPHIESTICFDPHIVIKILEDDESYEIIKEQIVSSDKRYIWVKIKESQAIISEFKSKKEDYANLLDSIKKKKLSIIMDKYRFTEKDEEELIRLNNLHEKLLEIERSYTEET